jgi:hypothetical protein
LTASLNESSLPDLQFSTLFLQYPFAAMSLWNAMQRFYALDRLGSASKESLEKIGEWEEIPPFRYLEAGKVEKRRRSSLQELGKEIKESSKQSKASLPQKESLVSSVSEKRNDWEGISKATDDRRKSEALLRRIDGIYSGIAKLDASLREPRPNLKEYLESIDLAEEMLKRALATAGVRYSMFKDGRQQRRGRMF